MLKHSSTLFTEQTRRLTQVLPEKWEFVGRAEELAFLTNELGFSVQQPYRSIVGLWGLPGVGKSQLAAKFVHQQRWDYPEREIFWINGDSPERFEQSLANMLHTGAQLTSRRSEEQVPGPTEGCKDLMEAFFTGLNHLEDARWLLIIDGVNESLDQAPGPAYCAFRRFWDGVNKLKQGCVLITSRRRDVVKTYHPHRHVGGLKVEDAASLLRSQIHPPSADKGTAVLFTVPLSCRSDS